MSHLHACTLSPQNHAAWDLQPTHGFTATGKLRSRGPAAAKHHGAGYEGLELVPHHGSPGDPGAHAALAIADASGYESDATVFSEGTLSDDDDDRASREGLLPETGRLLSDAPPGAVLRSSSPVALAAQE